MSYLKFFQRKSTFRSFICLTVTTAILLLSYSALKTSNRIYAAFPDVARITNVNNQPPKASMITVYPSGTGKKGFNAVNYGSGTPDNSTLRQTPAALKIPNDGSTTKLTFYNGNTFAKFAATFGPNPQTETTYSYPCTSGVGDATFGWDNIKISDEEGSVCGALQLVNLRSRSSSAGTITVSPQREELTLIHAYNDKGYLVVDVLLGAIRVNSASNPTGIDVAAGNQYIELPNGRSRVQPINLDRAVQSPSVQDFFKLDDWSSDRPATELVRKFQESLQREPAPQ
jgi:hypothetical protein